MNDTKGCITLGHSNWSICSPRNLFLQIEFPLYWQATCRIPFSCMQRKGHSILDPKCEWHPGAFKLDHLQCTKPIFANWISTLLTGHMQHSLFLHAEKRALHTRPQKWMTPRGVWPWGIWIGPFAVNETYFCQLNFHFIDRPHAGFPFLACREKITPY